MKEFYDILEPDLSFSFPFDFPPGVTAAQARLIATSVSEKVSALIQERLQAYTQKLFIDRLDREMQMFFNNLGR
jgi:hypothetical protein